MEGRQAERKGRLSVQERMQHSEWPGSQVKLSKQ